jgi:nucleotide-binding universal stress UspA family protein
MFRRILVALDETEAGRSAVALAANMAREFDATVWLFQVTEHATRRAGQSERFVAQPSGFDDHAVVELQRAGIAVSGASRTVRDHHLVKGIVDEAARFGADVIVLGLERKRIAHHSFSKALQEQIARVTTVPVMIAPTSSPSVSGAPEDTLELQVQ